MDGLVVVGLVLVVVLAGVLVILALIKRANARRTSRDLHAHSEPGGPHAQAHDGASGMAAAKLADIRHDGWSG